MTFTSHWQIANVIEEFVGSVDLFRDEVYALEGDPFPGWWAARNPELAAQRTSLHEFVWALRLVGELDFNFSKNARKLARLSVATYPHVPELVPIIQLLAALSSGSAVELYGMRDNPCGPTWQALAKLTRAEPFSSRGAITECYCVDAAARALEESLNDATFSAREVGVHDALKNGPFSAERREHPGPLSMPEFFDSTHRAETRFEPCACISQPGGLLADEQYLTLFPSEPPAKPTPEEYWPVADRNELLRVLVSKGVDAAELERFLDTVAHGNVLAIEDATWVASPNDNRQLVDHDGFTLRIEPSRQEGFDEQITLRFRRGLVRGFLRFLIPSGIQDRMSWGAELSRALPWLTALLETDTQSPRDGRLGTRVDISYVSFDADPAVTIYGSGEESTRDFGPYQSLEDAARSAAELARRHFTSSERKVS